MFSLGPTNYVADPASRIKPVPWCTGNMGEDEKKKIKTRQDARAPKSSEPIWIER